MDSEIVLSTKKLDKIISFDQTSGILVCGSGCILESLDNYVKDKGYLMPIDLGAKGSCQIGGNISTNAGGLRLLRYGSLHGTVLGLEAVLPDGTVFDGLSTLRKDNTGYDLKQLFIGAEGTLGVVTAVSILTAPRPKYLNSALLAVKSFKDVCGIFELRHQLSEILSAFEFWDSCSNEIVHSHMSHLKPPLSQKAPFYVLLETSGSRQEHDLEKLEDFLELLMARELIVDGALATDYSKYRELWMIREGIPEACSKAGRVFKASAYIMTYNVTTV